MNNKQYNITLKTEFRKEGDVIVGIAPELNVSSYGRDLKDAKRMLDEAVELFLEECEKMGTLEEVLEESGFYPVRNKYNWRAPKILKQEERQFVVNPTLAHA